MQDLLLQPLFTVDLKHKKPGSYNFGYIDPLQFYGEISWTSASTADGHWIFHIVGYGVGENASVSEDWRAIADTETSVSLPHEAVIFIYHTNPYKKLFTFQVIYATTTTAQSQARTMMRMVTVAFFLAKPNFQTLRSVSTPVMLVFFRDFT
jgi:hypothetical protein